MMKPPSTEIDRPVTLSAAELRSQRTASAISRAANPSDWKGLHHRGTAALCLSAIIWSKMGV